MTRDALEIDARTSRLEALKADLARDLQHPMDPVTERVTRAAFAGVSLTLVAVEAAIEHGLKGLNQTGAGA